MSEIISNTLAKLFALLDGVVEIAQQSLAKLFKTLNDVVSVPWKIILGLIKQAEEFGLDVAKCTTGKLDLLEKIPADAVQDAKKCVENIVDQTKVEVESAIETVKAAGDSVAELVNEFLACGIKPSCLLNLLSKIIEFLKSVTSLVNKILADVSRITSTALDNINTCVDTIKDNAVENVDKSTTEITTCLINLIDGKRLH